jgi:fatty acid desaturase
MSRAVTKNPEWIREAIATGNRFHYKKKNPFRHNAINLLILAMIVGALVCVFLAGGIVRPLVYIPAAALVLGPLYLALITLVNHEGAHGMFIISKKSHHGRFWNRFFGWSVCAFFGMHFIADWEKVHIKHHLHPIEDDDLQFYKVLPVGRDLIKESVKMLLVPGYLFIRERQVQRQCPPVQHAESPMPVFPFVVTGLLWLIFLILTWRVLSWAVPVAALLGVQVLSTIDQFKLVLEHGGEVGREDNRFLRARTSLFPLRRLLLPLNVSLHFEHHLNYCVPWYDLPRYQRALRDVVPQQIQPFVFNHDVLGQLSGRKGKAPYLRSD